MRNNRNREDLLAALDRERAAVLDLLPRFSEDKWHGAARADGWTVHDIVMHLADSNYGLALMALGEMEPALPVNEQTGWLEIDGLNEQRRQKNATIPREKALSRMASSFDHARRAIEADGDFAGPSPYGMRFTHGQWLNRIVDHATEHREDLEQLLG